MTLWHIALPAKAQLTTAQGRVLDATTREPLPFVNVIFRNTKTGTTSDFEGYFKLSTEQPVDSVIVSYIGFNRQAKAVKKGQPNELTFLLQSSSVNLMEIEVKAGENPAIRIMKNVIKNKPINDKEKLSAYQYEAYNKIEFDFNNIDKKDMNNPLLKPFKFIFDYIDSSDDNSKPYLPFFISETISEYYYTKNPKTKKEVIKASKMSGVDNKSIAQFMGDMYQNVNLYDNIVLVFGKNFVSPISDRALLFYEFYLYDSLFIDSHWCYQMRFKPRRKQELTFIGNVWIADTAFAVKRIEMAIAEDANINFVNSMNVVQEYAHVDSAWMLEKDKLVIDFNIQKKQMGFYGRKTTSYRSFVIDKPRDQAFYTKADNLQVDEEAGKKNEQFWAANRHDTLNNNEKQIYWMVDTIQTLPAYKTWYDIVFMLATGYKELGNLEWGPYTNILSFNRVEGTRIRVGGRTSNNFSKWYELSGYVAYGLQDDKFKYMGGFRSFISKKPRQMVGLYYKNDYEVLGLSQNDFSTDNLIASAFRRNPLTKLSGVEQVTSYYEREWFPGLETRLGFVSRKLLPLYKFKYEFFDKYGNIDQREQITTSELRIFTRFAWDDKYIAGEFERTSVGTKFPVIKLQYTYGIKDFFKGDYTYHKLHVDIDDRFRTGMFGYTDYLLACGKIFGTLPYPLLEMHSGNETYFYNAYCFNMMNYYEFVSDQYAYAAATHHFEGLFFNKFPLLRKLKWREVASGKALVGKLHERNRREMIFPEGLGALSRKPYIELGLGVENIFKIFRVDAFWRVTYLSKPNAPIFGIRGTLQFTF